MTYRTASYLAELHPDQASDFEEQLERLQDGDPVKVTLGILLGADFFVCHDVCAACGVIVHDKLVHDAWHIQ
jgi:Cys-tRNA synthase (O-phospho-L-seryl-tRNA:Cys-tRNA synthase)